MIKLKRAYEKPTSSDGRRILVDRVWPRGVSKETLRLDLWLKDVAPSTALRKWFGHKPERWTEFKRRYKAELKHETSAFAELKKMTKSGTVTLVYGAKDPDHNQAVVLREMLVA